MNESTVRECCMFELSADMLNMPFYVQLTFHKSCKMTKVVVNNVKSNANIRNKLH